MEKDQIILIAFSVVLGAILGFSMSYIMYDNRIASLDISQREIQNIVNNLQSDLTDINISMFEIQSQLQLIKDNVTSLNTFSMAINNSIQNVQNNLYGRMDSIENQKWHLLGYWESNKDFKTEPFLIQGTELKIKWWVTGDFFNSRAIIRIFYANGTFFNVVGSSGYYGSLYCEIPIDETGNYYLDVWLININQKATITLYDYY